MSVEAIEALVQDCQERVGRVRPRHLSAAEDAAIEGTYREVVTAYAELRAALETLRDAPDTPPEVRTQAELAISDEHTAMLTDLYEVAYLLGAREGLRLGVVLSQGTRAPVGTLLRAIGDDATADRLVAEGARGPS